jgi:hypothetical protein
LLFIFSFYEPENGIYTLKTCNDSTAKSTNTNPCRNGVGGGGGCVLQEGNNKCSTTCANPSHYEATQNNECKCTEKTSTDGTVKNTDTSGVCENGECFAAQENKQTDESSSSFDSFIYGILLKSINSKLFK